MEFHDVVTTRARASNYTLPVSTFQVAGEKEKKSSDSCLISVNYSHYLVNFYIGGRVDAALTSKLDRHRIEHAVINTTRSTRRTADNISSFNMF